MDNGNRVTLYLGSFSLYIDGCSTVCSRLPDDGLLLVNTSQHHSRSSDADGFTDVENTLAQQDTAPIAVLVGFELRDIVHCLLDDAGAVTILHCHKHADSYVRYSLLRGMIATGGVIHGDIHFFFRLWSSL